MIGRHHLFSGHEVGQTPGDGEGQGSLAHFSSWDHKESDMNPMDRGAWQATVHRVAKSQTRLKRLSMHARTRGADNRDRSCSQGKVLVTTEQRGQGPS